METVDESTNLKENIKEMKEEMSTVKSNAQLYLIVYSLLMPEMTNTAAELGNRSISYIISFYLLSFILSIISYITELTIKKSTPESKKRSINTLAVLTGTAFSFTLIMYLTIFTLVANKFSINNSVTDKIFAMLTIATIVVIGICLTFVTTLSLTIPRLEATTEELANVLKRIKEEGTKKAAKALGWEIIIPFFIIYIISSIKIIIELLVFQ